MSDTLLISFSGGRTSAYMTHMLLQHLHSLPYKNVMVVFANTGCEDDRTLDFIHKCDVELNFGTVWVEGETQPEKGKGMVPHVVSYETAARNGEPFERMIAKGGIPNVKRALCTKDLKERTITNYMRNLGHKRGSYYTAIGIRADEVHRVSARMEEYKIVYPLVEWWPTTKQDALDFWSRQSFDLGIKEYEGNCLFCFKKSWRKLLTLAKERPEAFDFPLRMEEKYSKMAIGEGKKPPFHFYRGNRSVRELLDEAARGEFNPWTPNLQAADPVLDAPNGCSESCEIYPEK